MKNCLVLYCKKMKNIFKVDVNPMIKQNNIKDKNEQKCLQL